MELLSTIIIVAVILYFFGATIKKTANTTNNVLDIALGASDEASKTGSAQVKIWAKEQRADIAKRATNSKLKSAPSWDELDELLK